MKSLSLLKRNTLIKFLRLFSFILIGLVAASCDQDANSGKQTKTGVNQQITAGPSVRAVIMPVEGMSCSSCVSNVKKTVKSLNGVQDVEVSLDKRQATITYANEKISPEQISKAINEKGYKTGKAIEVKKQ